MNDLSNSKMQQTIRIPCPTGKHAIDLNRPGSNMVTVPEKCPACGIGLPDAYRSKVREIVNMTRFQPEMLGQGLLDIDIVSA